MKKYLDLLGDVYTNGSERGDRTGTGTLSIFGTQMEVDLADGFPVLTTKRIHFKSILIELLWFLRGDTNVKYLQDHGVSIWDEWADKSGDLGPVYGKQWRRWASNRGQENTIDQIANLVQSLKENPESRRHIVSAWNPDDVEHMALPPCHTLFQCYVRKGKGVGKDMLDLKLYARSIDIFLGLPFNIASYALLMELLAHVTGLQARRLIITFGDLHLYSNHYDQAEKQLSREPCVSPEIQIDPEIRSLDYIKPEQIKLLHYNPQSGIKAPIAV